MRSRPDGVRLTVHDATDAVTLVEDLADLYRAVYGAKEPQASNPFYSRERFLERLERYRAGRDHTLVAAREGGRLVGFVYGYVLTPESTWWHGVNPPLPEEFTTEDGTRTFAVNDMVVALDRQRRGIALAMHDELRRQHAEKRLTLSVRPDNTIAHAAYERWGYEVVGQARPSFPGAPLYDLMVLDRHSEQGG